MADCYWFSQGKCQLYTMPDWMVYSILARVPKAREDIDSCGLSCPDVDQAFIDFANNPDTLVVPEDKENAQFLEKVNRYQDYHRYIAANPTTPKPEDD